MSDDKEYEWKETVRFIFDEFHFGKKDFFNSKTARKIINIIDSRHYSFFCEPVAFEELKEKDK